jgi:hypothetical protein
MQLDRVGRDSRLTMFEVEEADAGDLNGRVDPMPRGGGMELARELRADIADARQERARCSNTLRRRHLRDHGATTGVRQTPTPTSTSTPWPTSTPIPTNTPVPVPRAIDPAIFALPASDFAYNARLETSKSAPNDVLVSDPSISFLFGRGSPQVSVPVGRQSGWYGNAFQVNTHPDGTTFGIGTHYLVSIFDTNEHAAAAFYAERTIWARVDDLLGRSPSPPFNGPPGEPGYGAYDNNFSSLAPYGTFFEQYFKRGRVLIQIEAVYGTPLASDVSLLAFESEFIQTRIGPALDAIATRVQS